MTCVREQRTGTWCCVHLDFLYSLQSIDVLCVKLEFKRMRRLAFDTAFERPWSQLRRAWPNSFVFVMKRGSSAGRAPKENLLPAVGYRGLSFIASFCCGSPTNETDGRQDALLVNVLPVMWPFICVVDLLLKEQHVRVFQS